MRGLSADKGWKPVWWSAIKLEKEATMSKDRILSTSLGVRVAGVVLIALLLSVSASGKGRILPASGSNPQDSYGKLPLYFQANRGQTGAQVKFLSRAAHDTVFLTSTEAVLVLTKIGQAATAGGSVLRMSFPGADPNPRVLGEEELPGKANYFIGNDPEKWHTNVPTYARVRYQHLYRGIDLVYYGNQRQL